MSRIPLGELFQRAIDVVEGARVRYLLYGGLAVPVWGEVRDTRDVDLVLQVTEEEAPRLLGAFRAAGFLVPAEADPLWFIDRWTKASLRGRDVDLALGATEFDEQALKRAVHVSLFDRVVPVATAEDLILYKLAAYRHKDLGDVEDILICQGTKLDVAYLRQWAQRIAEATGKFEVPRTLDEMLAEQGL